MRVHHQNMDLLRISCFGKTFPVNKQAYDNIKHACDEDAPAIVPIARTIPHIDKQFLTPGGVEEFIGEGDTLLLVQKEGGKPVGFLAGKHDLASSLSRILYFAVKGGAEGRGVASALVTSACKTFEGEGSKMILCDGETPLSQRILRKYGFESNGIHYNLTE